MAPTNGTSATTRSSISFAIRCYPGIRLCIARGAVKGKVKQSITGSDRPWGFQAVEAPRFQDGRHNEGGKVVSPTHWPTLLPRKYS